MDAYFRARILDRGKVGERTLEIGDATVELAHFQACREARLLGLGEPAADQDEDIAPRFSLLCLVVRLRAGARRQRDKPFDEALLGIGGVHFRGNERALVLQLLDGLLELASLALADDRVEMRNLDTARVDGAHVELAGAAALDADRAVDGLRGEILEDDQMLALRDLELGRARHFGTARKDRYRRDRGRAANLRRRDGRSRHHHGGGRHEPPNFDTHYLCSGRCILGSANVRLPDRRRRRC